MGTTSTSRRLHRVDQKSHLTKDRLNRDNQRTLKRDALVIGDIDDHKHHIDTQRLGGALSPKGTADELNVSELVEMRTFWNAL